MLTEKFNQGEKPDVTTYHIHIYYTPGQPDEQQAKTLARDILRLFPGLAKEAHEYDKPGGPHAVSNVAVHIDAKGFGEIVSWLQFNTDGLSALVHPKSGDVIRDHIDYGLWLGPKREGLLSEPYFAQKRREKESKPGPFRP